MTPEEHELLKRSIALAEENNDILRGIRSSMRLARLMTFLYWIIIIGITVGAFYFVQPYLQKALSLYGGAQSNLNNVSQVLDKLK